MRRLATTGMFVIAVVLHTGCWATHRRDAPPDAGEDSAPPEDTSPPDTATDTRPPPIRMECESTGTCTFASHELLAGVATGDFLQWLVETDTYIVSEELGRRFVVRQGGVERRFTGWFFGAVETAESIVMNVGDDDGNDLIVLTHDTLETVTIVEASPSDGGALGLAPVGAGFGTMRVTLESDGNLFLWWDVYDTSGGLLSSAGFPRPPEGGWSSTPQYTSYGDTLVLGWQDGEGCATALFFDEDDGLSETRIHCPSNPECFAEVVSWTHTQDERPGLVVGWRCDDDLSYLVGTLDARSRTATFVDVCATRPPVIGFGSDGSMRALVSRGFSLDELRFDAGLTLVDSLGIAERAVGLALRRDGELLYGNTDGEVFVARCAL